MKRRYNHFDWLIKRLEEKYPNICNINNCINRCQVLCFLFISGILPLPDKAAVGNFEEEFIAKRRAMLECWLNRMCAHPVISQSEVKTKSKRYLKYLVVLLFIHIFIKVFVHFLQCDENSAKWKQG